MIRSPDAPSLMELLLAVVVILLLIGAATWGVDTFAEYVKAVTP